MRFVSDVRMIQELKGRLLSYPSAVWCGLVIGPMWEPPWQDVDEYNTLSPQIGCSYSMENISSVFLFIVQFVVTNTSILVSFTSPT